MHRRDALKILAAAPLLAVGPCDPVPEDAPLVRRTIRRGPLVWTQDENDTIRVDSADPDVAVGTLPCCLVARPDESVQVTNLYVRLAPDHYVLAGTVVWRPRFDAADWGIQITYLCGPLSRHGWNFFAPSPEV